MGKTSEDYLGITLAVKRLEELRGKCSEHAYTVHLEAPVVNVWPHLLYLTLCVCVCVCVCVCLCARALKLCITDDISHQYFTMYQLKTKTFYKTIITSKTDNRCNSSFFLICSLCLNFSSCPHDISCCLSPGLNLMSCFSVSFNLKWLVFFSFVTLHIYLFGCARP